MFDRTLEDNDKSKEKLKKILQQCELDLKSLLKVQTLIQTIKSDIESELLNIDYQQSFMNQ